MKSTSAARRSTADEASAGCPASARTIASTGSKRALAPVPVRSTIIAGRPATTVWVMRMSAVKLAVNSCVRAPPPPKTRVVARRSRRSRPAIAAAGIAWRPGRSLTAWISSRGSNTTSPAVSRTGVGSSISQTTHSPSSTAWRAARRPPGNCSTQGAVSSLTQKNQPWKRSASSTCAISASRGERSASSRAFAASWMRVLHVVAAKLLMALIVLHVAAALWHHVVRRGRLLRRMGFGRRR
jgi:hypothetical protein